MRSYGSIASLILTACACATLCAAHADAQAAPSYIFTNLGILSANPQQFDQSLAYGVNDQGVVVGYAAGNDGNNRAFIYKNGKMTQLTALGGSYGIAYAINNNGQIVGVSNVADDSTQDAFRYNGTSYTDLSGGASESNANAINQNGVAAGFLTTASQHATRFNANGTVTDLGTLNGGTFSVGNGINNANVVVGAGDTATGDQHAFRYDATGLHDLGTIGGVTGNSYGNAINNNGVVTGTSDTAIGPHAFTNLNGVFTDLGILSPGSSSDGYSINDSGQVVGDNLDASSVAAATLFQNGKVYNLNTLTTGLNGFQLETAYGISNTGYIVGQAVDADGNQRAFLLTPNAAPVPEASTVIGLGGMLLLTGVGFARNRREMAA